jgi:3-oxoadipate enol-lactonase
MIAHANGIDMQYDLVGPPEAPVITFSNSLLSNLSMWDPQLDASKEYRVLRYDQRGHGGTEATSGEYDFDLLAEDIRALLVTLGISETHFVGLSMGGMTGQALTLNHPNMVQSLTLCDTRSHTSEDRKPGRMKRIQTANTDGIEPMVEGCIQGWFSDNFIAENADLMDDIRAMIRGTSVPGLIGCTYALNSQNHTPRLHEIDCPTLVIVGENDPSTPVSESKVLHERINDSSLVVLPNARHLSNIEQADLFNDALLPFIRRSTF